jgi:hypothetical protein
VCRDLTLAIQELLDSLGYFHVALLLIPDDLLGDTKYA